MGNRPPNDEKKDFNADALQWLIGNLRSAPVGTGRLRCLKITNGSIGTPGVPWTRGFLAHVGNPSPAPSWTENNQPITPSPSRQINF